MPRTNRVAAWPDTTSRPDDYIVGDQTTVVGDESTGGEAFINLLFGTENGWVGNQPPYARPVSPIDRERTGDRPIFRWIFMDDEGDPQYRFHVEVYELGSDTLVLDSGEVRFAGWPETTGRPSGYVVGDDTTIVGDEQTGGEAFIDLLFGTEHEWVATDVRSWQPDWEDRLPSGYYQWRVRVHDGLGWGPWSDKATFTTGVEGHIIPEVRYASRVRVKRGNEWTDITHRIAEGVLVGGNDQAVATLDLTLHNGTEYPSLAPRVKTSIMNMVAGRYEPLLDRYNEIVVEAGRAFDGSEPTEFLQMFGGYLGDPAETTTDSEGVTISIMVRDYAKQLQDDYIMDEYRFEPGYASDIIQQLLDRRHAEGHLPRRIELRVLGEDDFWISEPWEPQYMSTWDAIQMFAEQSNKDIRFMLDDSTGQVRLTYWTPSTHMVPGWIVPEGHVKHETLETTDAGNRYKITVRYQDSEGDLQEAVAQDETHRKPNEPLREALIEEGDTTLIRRHEDAQRLADAMLEGTKATPATDSLTIPFNPHMRIHDVLLVPASDIRSEAEMYAIEQLRHTFTPSEWRTDIVASETVKLRPAYWQSIEAKRGVNAPLRPEDIAPSRLLDAPTGVIVTSITGGVAVTWDEPADPRNLGMTIVRVRDGINALVRTIRTLDTSVEITSGLQAGQGYTATVQFEDIKGRVTVESTPDGAVAGKVPAGEIGDLTPDGKTGIVGNALVTTDGIEDRVAVGDVSGRPWGGRSLPDGTMGIWGDAAGLYLQGYGRILSSGVVTMPNAPDADGVHGVRIPLEAEFPRNKVSAILVPGTSLFVVTHFESTPGVWSMALSQSLSFPYYEPAGMHEGYNKMAVYDRSNPPSSGYRNWFVHGFLPYWQYQTRDAGDGVTDEILLSARVYYYGIDIDKLETFGVYSLGNYGIWTASYAVFVSD